MKGQLKSFEFKRKSQGCCKSTRFLSRGERSAQSAGRQGDQEKDLLITMLISSDGTSRCRRERKLSPGLARGTVFLSLVPGKGKQGGLGVAGFYSFQHMVIRLGFREQRSSHSEMYSRKRQIPAFVLCL